MRRKTHTTGGLTSLVRALTTLFGETLLGNVS